MRYSLLSALLLSAVAQVAVAHDGVVHKTQDEAARHAAETAPLPPLAAPAALPFDLGGAFELIDHTGTPRTEADPDGQLQLLFFGYANCPSICAVAMPLMGQVADRLAKQDIAVRPVMITVDPARDTVDNMGPALKKLHPDFVGLTGDAAALDHVYGLFSVESKKVFDDPEYGAVYAHGSHIYLLDGQGKVLTLIPPILSSERVADIVANYVTPRS